MPALSQLKKIALSLAIFVVYAIYRQVTRKRADQFLAAHLRKLKIVEKLFEEDEYELGSSDFCKVAAPTTASMS